MRKKQNRVFFGRRGRVLEQPVTGYPVTLTCWKDELGFHHGFHHSSSTSVGGQADMTEKSGGDYLTSGNLRRSFGNICLSSGSEV